MSEHIRRHEKLQGMVVFAERAIKEKDRNEETPWASSRNSGSTSNDYDVNGHRKRGRIDPDRRLAETVLRKCRAEITECRNLKKRWATQSILESTQSLHNSFAAMIDLHKTLIYLEPTGGIEPPTY